MKKKKTEEKVDNEEIINQNLEENDQIDDKLETVEDSIIEENEEEFNDEDEIEEKIEPELTEEVPEESEKNNKQTETIFSKRIEIPLVGLILTVLIFIIIIISLIIFKDNIFNLNSKGLNDNNVYSNQLSEDNLLNEEEKIGFDIITQWLDSYKSTNIEITSKILSYNINSISLNSKKDNKFIIMATYDVVPAALDNTTWTDDNGEKQGDTIKNKSRYFVIEKVNDNYEMTSSSATKPDINDDNLTEEKAILLIKNDFSDSDKLNLNSDSSMIDSLTEDEKNNVSTTLGGSLDDYFKITGSYRDTYILGTFLVNKKTQDKWFVDVDGEVFKLEKATGILNVAEFEVQGDLTMTIDQAILVTLGSFPKNKRQNLQLVENWTDDVKNIEKVEEKLGNLDDYYALKTSSSKGFILINKNGLVKEFVNSEGTVTDLLGVEDITTILE